MSLAGVGAFLAACAPAAVTVGHRLGVAASAAPSSTAAEACAPVIPEETAGPFPGDGTNGPDVLTESGVVRSDITTSFGASSGTAEGIPLTIRLLIQDEGNACEPLAGAAVYIVALRPRGPVLALLPGRRGPELPARRPGGGRRRHRDLHEHLPRRLLGALAARPLRGLPVDRRGGGRRQQDRDLADRPAQGRSATRCTRPPGYEQSVSNMSRMSLDDRRRVRRRRRRAPAGHDVGHGGERPDGRAGGARQRLTRRERAKRSRARRRSPCRASRGPGSRRPAASRRCRAGRDGG